MIFQTTRENALKQLNNFIEKDILNYNSKRNFDFGVNDRSNVSCLSPYLTHRIITEFETAKKVLTKHSFQKVDKFIQEIFWRIYWKGWLELRPKVWSDFVEDLKFIEDNEKYIKAINGQSEIECFNDWVKELKQFNYLHNHTRMLFASIWIFTLGLPWQKGAEFFLKHLFDGDPASNTLSWRWVAGIQTKGKNYLAQSWNINKFTNNRYKNVKVNENASPIVDKREYKILPLQKNENLNLNEQLIVFENEINLDFVELKKYKKIYYVLLSNKKRFIQLDQKVLEYKRKIIDKKLVNNQNGEQFLNEEILEDKFKENKNFDIIYPSIGENYSFLKRLIRKYDLKVNFIKRKEDEFCWNFSNKGYFNFKSNIPIILSNFKLN